MDTQRVNSYRLVINEYDYPNAAQRFRDLRFPSREWALDCVPRKMNQTSYHVEPCEDKPNVEATSGL